MIQIIFANHLYHVHISISIKSCKNKNHNNFIRIYIFFVLFSQVRARIFTDKETKEETTKQYIQIEWNHSILSGF